MVCISLNDDTSDPAVHVPQENLLVLDADPCWRLMPETDITWYCRPLLVRTTDMHVRVSHGDRQQMMDPVDKQVFNSIIAKTCLNQFNQYTYISLELDRPLNTFFRAYTCCHITVADAARIEDVVVRKL